MRKLLDHLLKVENSILLAGTIFSVLSLVGVDDFITSLFLIYALLRLVIYGIHALIEKGREKARKKNQEREVIAFSKGISLRPSFFGIQFPILGIVFHGVYVWVLCFAGLPTPWLWTLATLAAFTMIPFVIWLLRLFVHYKLCEDGLQQCIMWCTVRKIPWEKVREAVLFHSWTDWKLSQISFKRYRGCVVEEKVHGRMILVYLGDCPGYDPDRQPRLAFSLSHPLKSACIWVPAYLEERILAHFEKYCPRFTKHNGAIF